MNVRRALLSVSDKTGVVDFARGLAELDVEILSTGGTGSLLRSAGLRVTDVAALTGYPDILDGRVKTLHPAIHAGVIARRDDAAHMAQLAEHGIQPIDLVCANFYPFDQAVARGADELEAGDQIDVGGPALLRAAARNHHHVIVVGSPNRYTDVLDALRAGDGTVPARLRVDLARSAFRLTAQYDAAVANALAEQYGDLFPSLYAPFFEKVRDLRFGENPFQKAALYSQRGSGGPSVARSVVLWGKELSFNTLLDMDAALRVLREFEEPCCVIVRHRGPVACALADGPAAAHARCGSERPAAFGGVLGFNRVVDVETARAIANPDAYVSCVLAPGFDPQALTALTSGTKWGKSVRLAKIEGLDQPLGARDRDIRRILGGVLVQEYDSRAVPEGGVRVVSQREPTAGEARDLDFAWRVAKHVHSGAVVVAKDRAVLGVGAGQAARIDAVRIAVGQAGEAARGAVAASDAFLPFADAAVAAFEAGITALVEPGGSRNDHEIIAAADAAGAALTFTGMRHFRH